MISTLRPLSVSQKFGQICEELYIKIPVTSRDYIHGLWIIQLPVVSIHILHMVEKYV